MIKTQTTPTFDVSLANLSDKLSDKRAPMRIDRTGDGNFGYANLHELTCLEEAGGDAALVAKTPGLKLHGGAAHA